MSRLFYHTVQDSAGNLLFDVSGTMRLAGTGTLATIYGDEALTVILPNPMTNHASFGSFKCFLGVGDYDFYLAKSGYNFETLTGVQGSGSMADQDASAVAITGGSVQATSLGVNVTPPAGAGQLHVGAYASIQQPPTSVAALHIGVFKSGQFGILLHALENDAATNGLLAFTNVAGTNVGSITTTAAATAYNTASDARLKTAVQSLTGALEVVRALKPSRFRWKADDSAGVGFLAGEVQEVIPDGVITGERGAIDSAGNILPQHIDMSKLVPYLVGALQTLAGQVEILTERLAELEAGLGV